MFRGFRGVFCSSSDTTQLVAAFSVTSFVAEFIHTEFGVPAAVVSPLIATVPVTPSVLQGEDVDIPTLPLCMTTKSTLLEEATINVGAPADWNRPVTDNEAQGVEVPPIPILAVEFFRTNGSTPVVPVDTDYVEIVRLAFEAS